VAGETEPTRVCAAVSVANDDIGYAVQLLEAGDQRGQFPEGEKTGAIGEGGSGLTGGPLDDGEVRQCQHDDGREDPIIPAVVGDIGAGDEPERTGRVGFGHLIR